MNQSAILFREQSFWEGELKSKVFLAVETEEIVFLAGWRVFGRGVRPESFLAVESELRVVQAVES